MKARKYKTFNGLTGVLALFLAVLVCATSQTAMAQLPDVSDQYTVQVIDPPAGTSEILLTRVNEAGLVVMQYFTRDAPGQSHIGILENGTWTDIGVTGTWWCGASSPSASGRVALTYAGDDGFWHATIYHHGTYTPVPDNPDYQFWINAVNDHGLMSGVAFLPDGVMHGLLLNTSLSLFQIFDPPDSESTFPYGINNAGLVVGCYFVGSNFYGFLYDGQSFTDIKVHGAENSTFPLSINNSGEVGGSYVDSEGDWRGFLLLNGEFKDFTVPSLFTYGVDCINDRGQLSGEFVDGDGNWHGYIATPVRGGTRAGKK
jgi:hypothetical protein